MKTSVRLFIVLLLGGRAQAQVRETRLKLSPILPGAALSGPRVEPGLAAKVSQVSILEPAPALSLDAPLALDIAPAAPAAMVLESLKAEAAEISAAAADGKDASGNLNELFGEGKAKAAAPSKSLPASRFVLHDRGIVADPAKAQAMVSALKAAGAKIIDASGSLMLVEGDEQVIRSIVKGAWTVSPETFTPAPRQPGSFTLKEARSPSEGNHFPSPQEQKLKGFLIENANRIFAVHGVNGLTLSFTKKNEPFALIYVETKDVKATLKKALPRLSQVDVSYRVQPGGYPQFRGAKKVKQGELRKFAEKYADAILSSQEGVYGISLYPITALSTGRLLPAIRIADAFSPKASAASILRHVPGAELEKHKDSIARGPIEYLGQLPKPPAKKSPKASAKRSDLDAADPILRAAEPVAQEWLDGNIMNDNGARIDVGQLEIKGSRSEAVKAFAQGVIAKYVKDRKDEMSLKSEISAKSFAVNEKSFSKIAKAVGIDGFDFSPKYESRIDQDMMKILKPLGGLKALQGYTAKADVAVDGGGIYEMWLAMFINPKTDKFALFFISPAHPKPALKASASREDLASSDPILRAAEPIATDWLNGNIMNDNGALIDVGRFKLEGDRGEALSSFLRDLIAKYAEERPYMKLEGDIKAEGFKPTRKTLARIADVVAIDGFDYGPGNEAGVDKDMEKILKPLGALKSLEGYEGRADVVIDNGEVELHQLSAFLFVDPKTDKFALFFVRGVQAKPVKNAAKTDSAALRRLISETSALWSDSNISNDAGVDISHGRLPVEALSAAELEKFAAGRLESAFKGSKSSELKTPVVAGMRSVDAETIERLSRKVSAEGMLDAMPPKEIQAQTQAILDLLGAKSSLIAVSAEAQVLREGKSRELMNTALWFFINKDSGEYAAFFMLQGPIP